MAEKMKKEEEQILNQKHINSLLNEPRLNQWENDFINSIKQQIIYKDLTEKQMKALEKIMKKYAKK